MPGSTPSIGIEARGFIFASALAYALGMWASFPSANRKSCHEETLKVSYLLEYGSDSPRCTRTTVARGQRVLIIDDLLATGGRGRGGSALVEKAAALVAGLGFAVELTFLGGRKKLAGRHLFAGQYDQ